MYRVPTYTSLNKIEAYETSCDLYVNTLGVPYMNIVLNMLIGCIVYTSILLFVKHIL